MKNFLVYGSDPTINGFNEFLATWGIWISCALAGIIFITVLILFIYTYRKSKKNPTFYKAPKQVKEVKNEQALLALGGKDNIVEHSLNGSRIVLVLNDYSLVNESLLKEMGVDSIVKMSNKITLVIRGDASKFYKSLF